MRHVPFAVVGFVLCAALGAADIAVAQPVAPPTIHRVTVQPDTGVLTIAGTGLGPDMFASVDGQPVTVLPGASDTQMEVMAPATVLTTPGSYRLTVVDPVRRVGDAFVVASPVATVAVSSAALTGTPDAPASATVSGTAGAGSVMPAAERSLNGPAPLVIEDSGPPYRTAIGYLALSTNSAVGDNNTAIGAFALRNNFVGDDNTAIGAYGLHNNVNGAFNTASGVNALYSNTSGSYNNGTGGGTLYSNTTGMGNTASGYTALFANTTGQFNTATGHQALYSTTTGGYNTASGVDALRLNTTGAFNMASGALALTANTTGYGNTAIGPQALQSNTTGFSNTALGSAAGVSATTGSYNLFLGAEVYGVPGDTATIRIGRPYDGFAGQNRTFIAGIHGTQVTGSYLQVVVDANGQLGTLTPPVQLSGGATATPLSVLQQQVEQQQETIAAQQATIGDLLARLGRLEAASRASRRP